MRARRTSLSRICSNEQYRIRKSQAPTDLAGVTESAVESILLPRQREFTFEKQSTWGPGWSLAIAAACSRSSGTSFPMQSNSPKRRHDRSGRRKVASHLELTVKDSGAASSRSSWRTYLTGFARRIPRSRAATVDWGSALPSSNNLSRCMEEMSGQKVRAKERAHLLSSASPARPG